MLMQQVEWKSQQTSEMSVSNNNLITFKVVDILRLSQAITKI